MMKTAKRTKATGAADHVADEVEAALSVIRPLRQLLNALHNDLGLPPEQILACAHAEIVTAMIYTYGAEEAALRCEEAAALTKQIPSLSSSVQMARRAS